MTDLYLIAHKVRNEPAFDVATRMECPICGGAGTDTIVDSDVEIQCHECDSLGYWWIIPTSGHRAYPYQEWKLWDICNIAIAELPVDWPDHYPHALAPNAPKRNLIDLLNLRPKSAPTTPFPRRI